MFFGGTPDLREADYLPERKRFARLGAFCLSPMISYDDVSHQLSFQQECHPQKLIKQVVRTASPVGATTGGTLTYFRQTKNRNEVKVLVLLPLDLYVLTVKGYDKRPRSKV